MHDCRRRRPHQRGVRPDPEPIASQTPLLALKRHASKPRFRATGGAFGGSPPRSGASPTRPPGPPQIPIRSPACSSPRPLGGWRRIMNLFHDHQLDREVAIPTPRLPPRGRAQWGGNTREIAPQHPARRQRTSRFPSTHRRCLHCFAEQSAGGQLCLALCLLRREG